MDSCRSAFPFSAAGPHSYRRPASFFLSGTLILGALLLGACGSEPDTPAVSQAPELPPLLDVDGFNPPAARDLTVQALARLHTGDTEGAVPLLDRALEHRPNYLDTLLLKARVEAKEGDPQIALDTLETLSDLNLQLPLSEDPGLRGLAEEPRFQAVLAKSLEPRVLSEPAYELEEVDLIPESVVYDGAEDRFFVSSVRKRKIVTFPAGDPSKVTDFLVSSAEAPLYAVLGMALDAEAGLLWAVSSPGPQMVDFTAQEPPGGELLAIDLGSGEIRFRLSPTANEGRPFRLNDVTVAADGTVFATSSLPPGRLFRADGRAEEPTLEDFGDPGLRSPQGLAVSADGKTLFVADYSYGIAAHDTSTGARTWLEEPQGFFLSGIDGLTRIGDDLLAIQNGIRPHRVLRLRPELDEDGGRLVDAEILEQAVPQYSEPTLGAWIEDASGTSGRFVYVANSQWDRFDQEHQLPALEELAAPVLLSLPLTLRETGPTDDGSAPSPAAEGEVS